MPSYNTSLAVEDLGNPSSHKWHLRKSFHRRHTVAMGWVLGAFSDNPASGKACDATKPLQCPGEGCKGFSLPQLVVGGVELGVWSARQTTPRSPMKLRRSWKANAAVSADFQEAA